MRTNLAYIEQASAAAIDSPPVTNRTSVIAGFRVEESPRENPRWTEQRKSYRQSSELLRENLTSVGITPLAVLPKAWWREMVAAKGLYDLSPNAEGRVGVYARDEAEQASRPRYGVVLMLGISTLVFAAAAASLPTFVHWGLYIPLFVVSSMATFIILAVTHNDDNNNLMARFTSRVTAWMHVMCTGGNEKAMKRMLRRGSGGATDQVAIRLPDPPSEVAATLKKTRSLRYTLNVAVEPGAVAFAETPASIIALQIRRENAERAREAALERARLAALDPIIYVEEGSAVAIIAQFGDFPLEKELVDRVVAQQSGIA